jgi:Flp pilus assembly protein TadD
VAFIRNGRLVITSSDDNKAQQWEATTGLPVGPAMDLPMLWLGTAIRDGRRVVKDDDDITTLLQQEPAVAQSLLLTPISFLSLALSPDGHLMVIGSDNDNAAHLFKMTTGQPFGPPLQHQGPIRSVALSPDGRLALTGSADHTAKLWQTASGQPLGPPLQHQGQVLSVAFSSDGRLVLTGSDDNTARLWQVATCQAIGPPLRHQGPVTSVAFSPNGRQVLTGSQDNTARLWERPRPVAGSPQQVHKWVNSLTGLEMDDAGGVSCLDSSTWLRGQKELASDLIAGGTGDDTVWHLGQAWGSEAAGQWFAARWHLDRLVAGDPADRDYRRRRAIAAAHLGCWIDASGDFEKSLEPGKNDVQVSSWCALTLAGAGDLVNSRRVGASLLTSFRQGDDPKAANEVAWCCVRFQGGPGGPVEVVHLAEKALATAPKDPNYLTTLAAALYRAGRFGEAVSTLEKDVKLQGQGGMPWDWLLLAMAHQKLGHTEEARKWLAKACQWIDQAVKDDLKQTLPGIPFDWSHRLEMQLIRREAEELIRLGPTANSRSPGGQP